MDGNHTPRALHTELLEERRRHHFLGRHEGVGVEERAADNAYHDNGEPATEDLAGPAAQRTTGQGTQVRHDLGYRHGGLREAKLILQHGRVQVLGSVRLKEEGMLARSTMDSSRRLCYAHHKVETRHQQDEVNQQQPVSLQRDLTLRQEGSCHPTSHLLTSRLALTERLGFRETQTEEDDENRRAGGEPVQGSPTVRSRAHETAGECRRQQVAERIALLEQT